MALSPEQFYQPHEVNAPEKDAGGGVDNQEGEEFPFREYAEFFAHEPGPYLLEWLEESLPDIAERRRSMSPDDFANWFSDYLEQRWKQWKAGSSQS